MKVARLLLLVLVFPGLAVAQGVTLPEVERVVMDNGIVLILHQKDDVPLIGLEASIRGGAVSDPEGLGGTANLLAGLLEKGAGDRDAAEFAEAIDAVGGELSAAAETEFITVTGEFLARDADLMIELLADMLRQPALDEDEIRKLRERSIAELQAAKDGDVRALMSIYGNAYLFGEHPYGNSLYGNEDSLARITAADVRDYYAQYFGSDRLVIALAGDFDVNAMAEKLGAAFGDWEAATGELPEISAPEPVTERRVLLVDKPGAAQSYFWIGNVGVSVHFDRRAELDIANTLFGGRFTSILVDELRTKAGLTYGASSSLRRGSVGGSVAMISYTKTETTVEAIDLALSLLAKLRAEGVPDDMILSGKNYILGQFAPDLETAEQLAAQFAMLEGYGLDESYVDDYGTAIANADGEAIREVIKQVYPAEDNLVFVIIGDANTIREQVSKYGPITEIPITDPRFKP